MTDINFRAKGKDNSQRKFPGERGPRPDRADVKRTEALARNLSWQSLHVREQLTQLDARLGKGLGASRQRARLTKSRAA